MTNWLSNDEWHHIFGNKEAGEFILSMANSDPMIAVNLFAKMKALNLTSSGIAQNIALMKKYKHTQWHDFIKEMGFEPLSPMKKGKKLQKVQLHQVILLICQFHLVEKLLQVEVILMMHSVCLNFMLNITNG